MRKGNGHFFINHPTSSCTHIAFYEIYQGQLYDLLNDRKRLHAREDGNQNVVIQGIDEFEGKCGYRCELVTVTTRSHNIFPPRHYQFTMFKILWIYSIVAAWSAAPVCVNGLRLFVLSSYAIRRHSGQTGANDESSRSHAILQIALKQRGGKRKQVGKFSFIDLAGSERGADRGDADSKTRYECSTITQKRSVQYLNTFSQARRFRNQQVLTSTKGVHSRS